jgi:hypothetical protein
MFAPEVDDLYIFTSRFFPVNLFHYDFIRRNMRLLMYGMDYYKLPTFRRKLLPPSIYKSKLNMDKDKGRNGCMTYFLVLKMEAASSSEKLVNIYHTTLHHIQEAINHQGDYYLLFM